MTDRRHVDTDRVQLTGEAAGQRRDAGRAGYPVRRDSADHRRSDTAAGRDEGGTTYYDRPVIKEPVWIWSVPAYFYTGGVAAGAAVIGAVAQSVDRDGLATLVERSRWLATAGTAVGTAFLIHDLGQPARFLHMLRVFRPTSAMSMGSWTLAATSTAAAGAAILPKLGLRRLGDVAGLAAGALAPALGTYTAVLISDTAVPIWQATRTTTPPFFAASALVGATSALQLTGELDERSSTIVRRLGIAASVADLATGHAVERHADEVERVGRPLRDGASGALWTAAKSCTAASLGVSLLPVPARYRDARRVVSAVLGAVGSLAARFAIVKAGTRSARDPRATFDQQRAGRGGAEVAGWSATASPADRDAQPGRTGAT